MAVVDRECDVVRRMMVVSGEILAVVSGEMVVMRWLMGLVRRKLAVVGRECEVVRGKLDSGGEILGVVGGMKGLPRPRTQ